LAYDEPNNKSYELLQVFADASWEKVREYRNRSTKESPAYYAAMMFDPRQKTGWFEENWIEDHQAGWLAKELDNVKSLWEDEYKGRHAAYFSPPTPAYKCTLLWRFSSAPFFARRIYNICAGAFAELCIVYSIA
jgi:hypothetical protein